MQKICGSTCLAIVWLATNASNAQATSQAADGVRYQSKDCWLLEYPLESLWIKPTDRPGRMAAGRPDFDMDTAANRKGYTATWKIRDSKRYLVSFKAKINGKRVKFNQLVPGAKLPFNANWFTGKLHIPTGDMLLGTGVFNPKFERLEVLEVEKGIITERSERRNARRDEPADDPAEEATRPIP
jgi:hypothetical protein